MTPILLLIVGLSCLLLGADWVVRGASSLAKRFHVSEIAIGLTVVALGTSAPELIVNIMSSLNGHSDMAFGNVIGSNNFNILVILGISSLIFPLEVQKNTTWKEIPYAILAAVIVLILVNDQWFRPSVPNILSRVDGLIMIGLFCLFLFYSWKISQTGIPEVSQLKTSSAGIAIGTILLGLGGLILGGNIVVKQAVIIARQYGISEKVIALTIVSAGTSLPELVTSAVAAFKKHPDIAIGNIIGSNIFNLLLVLGVSALITPAGYRESFNIDFVLMILASVLLFVFMFSFKRHKLDRVEGGILLTVYVVYTVFFLR
jgi:cation:H+ antiporter